MLVGVLMTRTGSIGISVRMRIMMPLIISMVNSDCFEIPIVFDHIVAFQVNNSTKVSKAKEGRYFAYN